MGPPVWRPRQRAAAGWRPGRPAGRRPGRRLAPHPGTSSARPPPIGFYTMFGLRHARPSKTRLARIAVFVRSSRVDYRCGCESPPTVIAERRRFRTNLLVGKAQRTRPPMAQNPDPYSARVGVMLRIRRGPRVPSTVSGGKYPSLEALARRRAEVSATWRPLATTSGRSASLDRAGVGGELRRRLPSTPSVLSFRGSAPYGRRIRTSHWPRAPILDTNAPASCSRVRREWRSNRTR